MMESGAGVVLDVKTSYVSSACNRTALCCDWGRNGLICFGSSHAVALYRPKSPAIIFATLVEHKDRVNCVKWIHKFNNDPETEFISASQDKTAILWQQNGNSYVAVSRLEGHDGAVTIADAIYAANSSGDEYLLVATASVDSTVKIWQRKPGQESCLCMQTLVRGQSLALCLAWVILPNDSTPLLACALDDLSIHLHVEMNGEFVEVMALRGHEEWIRSLDFAVDDAGDILLASSSQDTYIRLWRISRILDKSLHNMEQDCDELRVKEKIFSVSSIIAGQKISSNYKVRLESVLQGHDNWVLSTRWQPAMYTGGVRHQPMCLLSASMDKTLIVWQPSADSGIWMEKSRVGEIGGSNLGFFGGVFSPDGSHILAHGFHGAFHLWRCYQDSWQPEVTCGGHFGPVHDIAWNSRGEYLISVSSDQTSRLHGCWNAESKVESCWHELARPQIHGYDIQCVAMLNRFSFASGADEKVVRIFQAPKNFLDNFQTLTGADVSKALEQLEISHVAEGASVPALGLSNKAVYSSDSKSVRTELKGNNDYSESYFAPQILTAPPTEENLLQNTLWPEEQKLYGHGYEIFALACHPSGLVLASACKATKSEHASIILWNTISWRILARLESHSLTVTQLKFSHKGDFLLSVSRDRTWSLFQNSSTDLSENLYKRVACSDKKTSVHSRIIWACAWTLDDQYFITVSRDKRAVVWGAKDNQKTGRDAPSCLTNYGACSHCLELPDSITAVDTAPAKLSNKFYLVAFGLESGVIWFYSWSPETNQSNDSWSPLFSMTQSMAHHLPIKRLQFRPQKTATGDDFLKDSFFELASCSEDNSVKISKVIILE